MRKSNTLFLLLLFTTLGIASLEAQPDLNALLDLSWQEANRQSLDSNDFQWTKVGENSSVIPGIHYRYYQLTHEKVPFQGIIASVIFKDGIAMQAQVPGIDLPLHPVAKKITRTERSLLAGFFRVPDSLFPALEPRQTSPDEWNTWPAPELTLQPVLSRFAYHPDSHGSWQIMLIVRYLPKDGSTLWETGVDPDNGKIIYRTDLGAHCVPGPAYRGSSFDQGFNHQDPFVPQEVVEGSAYRVFPYPGENPLVATPQLVTNPADPVASPFGWHDINGVDGADVFTTSGNNARIYLDRNADFEPDSSETSGGAQLQFDFPFHLNQEPETYRHALETQFFYQINILHDVMYHHGFGEEANFQVTNYSGQGKGNDPVIGLSQFGADRGRENNADFVPSTDGNPSYLRPYLWGLPDDQLLTVLAPANIAGTYKTASAAFGPSVSTTALTGKVVLVDDGSNNPTFGCGVPLNASAIRGNIAMIDRGECTFQEKALFAEAAGAIGCIICNYEDQPVDMGAANGLADPNIPTISLSVSDCARLRSFAGTNLQVRFQLPSFTGPNRIDATLDNGVVAHEYFHGVSQRLVGGPGTIGCLNNPDYDGDGTEDDGEQMDEGWSDFFALYMTTLPEDDGTKARPIGHYLTRSIDPLDGVRAYPYSTDLTISPYDYHTAWNATVPHGVGAVGNAILWDIYWALTDHHGYDSDLMHGNGGNNRALRLLVESLKVLPCNPGFTDMRKALITTDRLLYDGVHECQIWEAFARRGVGYSARQNNPLIVADGISAFDEPPGCSRTIYFAKTMTPLIHAGDTIWHRLFVRNDQTTPIAQASLSDNLPEGLTFLPNTATQTATLAGNTVQFSGITLAPGDSLMIEYATRSNPSLHSTTRFLDDLESGDGLWDIANPEGTGIWSLENTVSHSGTHAWFVPNTEELNDQIIQLIDPITVEGSFPALRFYHRWNTQWGRDAGIVEVSTNGSIWQPVDPYLLRTPYNGPVKVTTFSAPDRQGFYGQQNQYIASYLDLRPYSGQHLFIRFRFGSDDAIGGDGWWIDDVELMDLHQYQSTACLHQTGSPDICIEATNQGTFVESIQESTAREEPENRPLSVFPNPYQSNFQVVLPDRGQLQLWSLTGQLMREWAVPGGGRQLFTTPGLPPACYLLIFRAPDGTVFRKVLVKL